MFAKLLKYEWKASWRQLGIVSLAALAASGVGAVLLRVIEQSYEELPNVVRAATVSMLRFLCLGLVAYSVGAMLALYLRYYRNKFTDEGYLTFTLPVKSWQIFLSSLINILVWTILVGLVALGSFTLIFAVGANAEMQEVLSVYEELFQSVYSRDAMLWGAALGALSLVTGTAMMLSCITIGASLAKRHKLLAAFGIYYGGSVILGITNTVLLVTSTASTAYMTSVWTMQRQETLVEVLIALGGSILSCYLMKKKLNLP